MKLILTDEDGVLLDQVDITVDEWREELRRSPFTVLAHLQPGDLSQVDQCQHVKTAINMKGDRWCLECGRSLVTEKTNP